MEFYIKNESEEEDSSDEKPLSSRKMANVVSIDEQHQFSNSTQDSPNNESTSDTHSEFRSFIRHHFPTIAIKNITQVELLKRTQELKLGVFLTQTIDGLAILKHFEDNNHLQEEDKNKLSRLLISWVLRQNTEPDSIILEILRDKILKFFPGEVNCYYIPNVRDERGRIIKRYDGKLTTAKRTIRATMVSKGIAKPLRTTKEKNPAETITADPLEF